jgi:hypothetical protein
MKYLLSSAAAILASVSAAQASPIDIRVTSLESPFGLSETGTYRGDTGRVFLGPMDFPTQPLQTFQYNSIKDLGAVTMELCWVIMGDKYSLGSATVFASSGEFINDFPIDADITVEADSTDNILQVKIYGENDLTQGGAGDPPSSVPEPGTLLLLCTAAGAFLTWRGAIPRARC